MTKEKELYRGEGVMPKSPQQTFFALLCVAALCIGVLSAAPFLPFSWLFEIGIIAVSAVMINSILKKGPFSVTYVLYENSLEVMTRYGLIEKVTATYILKETVFTETTVTANGKTLPFYPDENLKKLLNLNTPSY